jgi:release factor glutamine methyltransferase
VNAGRGGDLTIDAALRVDGLDRVDAKALLRAALHCDDAYLIAHGRDRIAPVALRAFRALVARRLAGEPVAYIVGRREFYGLAFVVSPAVLIPRPETELLVDLALERMPPGVATRVLDLGTGSGCIAIAIAHARPAADVVGVDCSAEAVAVARANARTISGGDRRLRFRQGDWYAAVAGERFDVIVSNPPYVAAGDPHLAIGDLRFEPSRALSDGADGLDCIREIIRSAHAYLRPGGWLLLEHGLGQDGACRELLTVAGFGAIGSAADVAGIPRVTFGKANSDSRC